MPIQKPIASIILNRNLPEPTNKLYNHIKKYDGDITDIYIVESGSDDDKLSANYTWHVKDEQTKKQGLRYPRGMNFALNQLYYENKFNDYEAFFLITNDTELEKVCTIKILYNFLLQHKKLSIISPCSKEWGEKILLVKEKIKYFWFIHNSAYLIKKSFIKQIAKFEKDNYMQTVFDGNNFRGYGLECELLSKAYANNWAAGITSEVWAEENNSYLINKSELIKTETIDENLKLYIEEGKQWLKSKYGFNSKWDQVFYAKAFYENFFKRNKDLIKYKI